MTFFGYDKIIFRKTIYFFLFILYNRIMRILPTSEIHENPFTKIIIARQCPSHTHTFFEFIINLSGEFENCINGVTYTIKKGHVLLLRPEDQHHFSSQVSHTHRDVYVLPEKMKAIADCISPSLYEKLANQPLAVFFKVSDYQLQTLEGKLNYFNAASNYSKLSLELAHTNVVTELLSLWQQSFDDKKSDYPEWLNLLFHRLNTEDYLLRPLSEIIASTNYSYGYVCRQFKKYTGTTLNEYVSKEKFAYAVALLQNREARIADVAEKLNYGSPSNFIIAFKKRCGLTPAQWRKKKPPISMRKDD